MKKKLLGFSLSLVIIFSVISIPIISSSSETDPEKIRSLGAEDIGRDYATIWGEVKILEEDPAEISFEYREKGTESWIETSTSAPNDEIWMERTFHKRLTGLEQDTNYEYRALVEYADGHEEIS